MDFLKLTYHGFFYGWVLFAIVYGILEARVYQGGFKTRGEKLLGFFSTYHSLMFLTFLIAMRENWFYLPIMFVVEDISYFIAHSEQSLNKDSWVNFGLGGTRLFGQWIPLSYMVGVLLSVVTYFIAKIL